METIGSEVGYKMRAAIKAKLNELGCYVDDELPDYVMVMVANKRSRTQMEEDLQLFLGTKTEMFVHWLHQVLQKLQEVKVPPVDSKEGTSSQASDTPASVKKEKKDKKHKKSKKQEKPKKTLNSELEADSSIKITDVLANQLLETVKSNANLLDDTAKADQPASKPDKITFKDKDSHKVDDFDIPTISEIEKESSKRNEKLDVETVDKNIESNRKAIEFDEDILNLNNDAEELMEDNTPSITQNDNSKCSEISYTPPKKSVIQRIGQKNPKIDPVAQDRVKGILLSNIVEKPKKNNQDSKPERPSVHSRLGARPNNGLNNRISSKIVAIAPTPIVEESEQTLQVTVPSVIKVKPRPQLPMGLQANRNLLLKAMADAQKSIAQVMIKPQKKPLELYTRKYRFDRRKQISYGPKSDIRVTVGTDVDRLSPSYRPSEFPERDSDFQEYVPSQISKSEETVEDTEMESEINLFPTDDEKKNLSPQFVVTLEGLDTSNFPSRKRKMLTISSPNPNKEQKIEVLSKNPEKRKHTPIVYDRHDSDDDLSKSETKQSESIVTDSIITDETPSELDKSMDDSEITDGAHDTIKVIINDRVSDEQSLTSSTAESIVRLKEIQSKYDHIPDELPEIAKKEKCKYYPSCRLGDTCEFLHPTPSIASTGSSTSVTPCKAFPNCKFGQSCIYLHPLCKFGAGCMKMPDCIYNHGSASLYRVTPYIENDSTTTLSSTVSVVPNALPLNNSYKSNAVICRFHPMCSNIKCTYYHPKFCRFGKYCNNRAECNFYHHEIINKDKFFWKPVATTTTT